MKRFLLLMVTYVFSINLFFSVISVSAKNDIVIYVDSEYLSTSAPVLTVAGRTMVPMRNICEALGYDVDWNGNDQSIMITQYGSHAICVSMRINTYSMNRLVKSNNPCQVTLTLDVPPMLINNIAYLPVRALAEALWFDVEWNIESSSIYITSPNYRVSSINQGTSDKLMMYSNDNDYVGLMDLYGNIIVPMGPAPTYEEVLSRTDLVDFINSIEYFSKKLNTDGGAYVVYLLDKEGRLIFSAHYALDGTVYSVSYYKNVQNGVETYCLKSTYNPYTDSTIDSLYLREYEDNNGNRFLYNEDGTIKWQN